MRCGLYGKLPCKRDFIAISTPRAFLRVWEPWLEAGLKEGREQGAAGDWTAIFNSAPIWRFWLGPALCGEAFTGALMPSVDALGRMFPLTLTGAASGADALEPPDVAPRDQWFAEVEDLLLDALDPDAAFETLVERLAALGAARAPPHENALARLFAAMRREQPALPAETATFWWTVGGADCPPLALMREAMPTPATFADMMSRRQSHLQDAEKENRPQAIVQSG
ncbi:Type VI secretion-associated protein, BMA_A0400 family [Methylocella tundrae]|uniref:Type VI secretion-associated protein, BMA_A0400 family n=1 Tax=Methylocella tundrae TaxID=227605 RepID=A0A8B6M0J8_METTU|nr:type VI secretion system-associated protein TagF [Methylocella tundrae]VTZ27576.1 Type VI secretion-associated protein, BMA_A0400 family [Methylocella tundrae]VTZ48336.1 Type VI secretion-associated protein, BMA_A0400 family [Methylocella tundrae]